MSFKVGDRVVVVATAWPEYLGAVTTILAGPEIACRPSRRSWVKPGDTIYTIDLDPGADFRRVVARPQDLELYRPDDREPAAWTEDLLRLCQRALRSA